LSKIIGESSSGPGPMLGFKRFDSAAVTISGIELMQKIQKHQFKTGALGGRSATMPELWNAVLAA
jgi:transposase-like protein